MKKMLPFNAWSKDKIQKGIKRCTSRNEEYDDPRVDFKLKDMPLWFVKKYLYGHGFEGADSPEEFQKVWESIHPTKGFDPNQKVIVHFGDFKEDEVSK